MDAFTKMIRFIGQIICWLRGRHLWRRQTKAERNRDIAIAARMAAIGDIKVTVLLGKVCRRCEAVAPVKRRKPDLPRVDPSRVETQYEGKEQ